MATLFKRGNVWYSKLEIHGKEVRKPLSSNRRIAEELLADLIKLRGSGGVPTDMPLPEFKRRYIGYRRASNIKPKTLEADEHSIQCLIESSTLRNLSHLTPQALNLVKADWIASRLWRKGPKSGKPKIYAINRDMRHIKMAMNWAHHQGYAPRHDWKPVKQIKTPKGRLHFWTVEELSTLKETCRGVWRTMVYLGGRAGLRPAEMHWLEWPDIDFERNRIHIAPKPHWIPKDHERRWIPMAKDLRSYLEGIFRSRTDSRVLNHNGGVPGLGYMSVYFRKLVHRAKLKGSLYTLRHTFASHYVQAGGDIYRLKEYLGHSSIEMTQIYAHLAPAENDKTLDRMPSVR